jgi:hypothetical protein
MKLIKQIILGLVTVSVVVPFGVFPLSAKAEGNEACAQLYSVNDIKFTPRVVDSWSSGITVTGSVTRKTDPRGTLDQWWNSCGLLTDFVIDIYADDIKFPGIRGDIGRDGGTRPFSVTFNGTTVPQQLISRNPSKVKMTASATISSYAYKILGGKNVYWTGTVKSPDYVEIINSGGVTPNPNPTPTPTPTPNPTPNPTPDPTPTPTPTPPPNNSIPNNKINTGITADFGNLDETIGNFRNPLQAQTVPELISSIIRVLFLLVSIAAVIIIIISGFRMVLASGNEEQLTKAKKALTWAVIGLIVSLMSFSIVAIIQNLISRK